MEDVRKLFIFEMANNHQGIVSHGYDIIDAFAFCIKQFPQFDFAFKFQMRDPETFIHPEYKNRNDIKYVNRFNETFLPEAAFRNMKERAENHGFKTICTAFDEASVDIIEKMKFDYIKIASCSLTDWPLLNTIAEKNIPIVASTAGSSYEDIHKVFTFFSNRSKELSLMHCVGSYPTSNNDLQLNQISELKKRYSTRIGFSTHEEPENLLPVSIAMALGASIFERHVALPTEYVSLPNSYSSTPQQIAWWLTNAAKTETSLGSKNRVYSEKEQKDLRTFKRGAYLKRDVLAGDKITRNDVFYAFPNMEDQVLANDMSKYASIITKGTILKNAPLLFSDIEYKDEREQILTSVRKIRDLVLASHIVVPPDAALELSHHGGMENFEAYGLSMLTAINDTYCKKYLISLPNQLHPEHTHKVKKETFFVLYGELRVYLDNVNHSLSVGDMITIEPNTKHWFVAGPKGCVVEELSTTHIKEDSYYSQDNIQNNKYRKTYIGYWRNA